MVKWLIGIGTAALLGLGGIASHFVTGWVDARNADHETLRDLVNKDKYLNGSFAAAPVAPIKEK